MSKTSDKGAKPRHLLLRALISVLVLPGTFAGIIPAWIVFVDHRRGHGCWIGAGPLAVGVALLFWCVRDFYVSGKGTLAPWDPPRHLVVTGAYQLTRNPMYVGISIFLTGWCLLAGSWLLAAYAVILTIGFHLRVRFYEEPRLIQLFGDEWRRYAAAVPRWLAWPSKWRP